MSDDNKRGRLYAHTSVEWKRWGLGVEFSFGYWWPPEWSVFLIVGPVLLCAGWEEDADWEIFKHKMVNNDYGREATP